jgi:DNA primase
LFALSFLPNYNPSTSDLPFALRDSPLAAMPSPTTELIKSKLDIVEFLRGYLTLTQAGRNFKGLCPFHKEKSPSFMVSPERQSWHCFGCGIGGDIFAFVMRHENMDFGEALRLLAEKSGVELKHENPAEWKYSGLLYELNDSAKNFFRKMLAASDVAKKYLAERGLAQATIDMFEIGWAPNEPEALSMHLLNGGAAPQDIIQAGLSIKTERGLMLDRFRGRIMFPIHNHLGKVVGFTGRILPQFDKPGPATAMNPTGFVPAKYVNSPETPIFQKSKLLYGFWKSRDAVREAKSAVLMEGQMDFLMSWQSGVTNVIASSGTALTADHLRSVHRLAEEIVVCFDNDAAGSDAAERAIDLAESNDFTVKVATFKDFKDAADAAKANPENVRKTVAAAVPAPQFYFDKYLPHGASGAAFSTREGLQSLRAVLAKLKGMASPVERDYWMNELAKRTGVAEKTLREEAERAENMTMTMTMTAKKEEEISKRQVSRQELIIEQLLSAALTKNDFAAIEDSVFFFAPPYKEILALLKSGKRSSPDLALDAIIGSIVLRSSDVVLSDAEMTFLKNALAKEYYKERRRIIALAIRNAEANGNEAELKAAMEELSKLPGAGDE